MRLLGRLADFSEMKLCAYAHASLSIVRETPPGLKPRCMGVQLSVDPRTRKFWSKFGWYKPVGSEVHDLGLFVSAASRSLCEHLGCLQAATRQFALLGPGRKVKKTDVLGSRGTTMMCP